MGFLSDLFSDKKEIDRCNFYLTGLVSVLNDDMRVWLGGRIEGLDYYYNWYKVVAFILFVIRIAHTKADIRSEKKIEEEIKKYIYDTNNTDSYLNKFDNPQMKSHLDPSLTKESLAENVFAIYNEFLSFFTQLQEKDVNPAFSLNEHLAKLLATDDDRRNLQDAFSLLGSKFANGEFKLYKA